VVAEKELRIYAEVGMGRPWGTGQPGRWGGSLGALGCRTRESPEGTGGRERAGLLPLF